MRRGKRRDVVGGGVRKGSQNWESVGAAESGSEGRGERVKRRRRGRRFRAVDDRNVRRREAVRIKGGGSGGSGGQGKLRVVGIRIREVRRRANVRRRRAVVMEGMPARPVVNISKERRTPSSSSYPCYSGRRERSIRRGTPSMLRGRKFILLLV